MLIKDKTPANSPDLNPIEWLWNDMKHFIRSKGCQTQRQIIEAVEEYFDTLTVEKCSKFIDRLRGVMEEIILSGGEWVGK